MKTPNIDTSTDFPDLRVHFKHAVWRPMPHSKGVPVGSDFEDKEANDPVFGIYKQCGFWAVDEARILFIAAYEIGGYWLDVGGLTGWTAAHLAAAGCHVASLDPMYTVPAFRERAVENLRECGCFRGVGLWPGTSDELFSRSFRSWSGVVIDGDHNAPHPLHDAMHAAERVVPDGLILLHDTHIPAVREAHEHLSRIGWKVQLFNTVHGIALCHRGDFVLPRIV